MAMKGHKRGCKCVGCSAATRKRGMAALKKATGSTTKKKSTRKPRKNPSTAAAAPKRATSTRKNPSTAAAAPKRATSTRKNPAPCRCPRMPKVNAGAYLVLATVGGKMRPIKEFSRIREAEEYAKTLPTGAQALVTQVKSTWG